MPTSPLTNLGNLRGLTDENGALKVVAVTAGAGTSPLTPFPNLRGTTDETGALRMAAITLNPPISKPTDLSNLRVCTDETGALLVATQTAGATVGPLTNLGNLQARTDARGSLVVASVAGGSLQTPLTPTLNLRGRTDENGALVVTGLAPSSPLLTSLVSYWKLNEASGTRVDSVGTNTLTPTNAPVGAPGKIGNGAALVASSSQFLSHADPTPLGDEDWTYSVWFKRASVGVTVAILGKDDNANNRYYWTGIVASGDLYALYYPDGNAQFFTLQSGFNNTNWHFLVMWHDATLNTINLQIDNGTATTTTYTTTWTARANYPVKLGAHGNPNDLDFFDGLIDEVGLWRRVLTPAERTTLYNGGAGLTYPFA